MLHRGADESNKDFALEIMTFGWFRQPFDLGIIE